MRSRAFRRWQAEKKKKKVRKYLVNYRHEIDENGKMDWTRSAMPTNDPHLIGMSARSPKCCSCYMCGNPRKHWNALTMQELKALDDGLAEVA